MSQITPYLWFDNQAEEAARFYTGIFKNSKITQITHYSEAAGRPTGSVMTVAFELDGRPFVALNGGPMFKFSEAISFSIPCETQEEVDELWQKLTDGGEEGHCGWLKDRYGVSWQVVPNLLIEMLQDSDNQKVENVTRALFQMKKLNIKALKEAYDAISSPVSTSV